MGRPYGYRKAGKVDYFDSRKFGGISYELYGVYDNPKSASNAARKVAQMGKHVRITHDENSGNFYVWRQIFG